MECVVKFDHHILFIYFDYHKMTIHRIFQIIGYKIPCYKLFKTIFQNNNVFQQEVMSYIDECDGDAEKISIEQICSLLEDHINGNTIEENERTDFIMGCINDMMHDLVINNSLINDKDIEIYRLTHDVCEQCDFVIGIKFNEIIVRSYGSNDGTYEYEWDFETLQKYGPSCTKILKDLQILSPDAGNAKIFNVQDDCRCCS